MPFCRLGKVIDFALTTPLPGMPAEVFVATGERTALSYLVKPLTDALARTFREE